MDKDAPLKLVLTLQHEYTSYNLSFDGLKGNDRHFVDQLRQVVLPNNDRLVLHLMLANKTQSGKDLISVA